MKVNLCVRRSSDGPVASVSPLAPASASTNHGPLSNLFARLDDNTARRLCSLAQDRLEELNSIQRPNHGRINNTSGLWAVSDAAFSTRVESGVEFLPLRIEIRSDQAQQGDDGKGGDCEGNVNVIYASYNGGSVHLTSAEQQGSAIELDQHLLPDSISASASSLNVDVRPLSVIYNAGTVHLEPLSSNDWELLEVHADELESGSLLRQVCVIYPNQRLPIRLGRYGDIAWVKVLAIGFERLGLDIESDSDSEFSYDGFNDLSEKLWHDCLRLVANTEIVIAPKMRSDGLLERSSFPICNLSVYPTNKDYSNEMKDLFAISSDVHPNGRDEEMSVGIPECPQWFTGAVHSSTFAALTCRTNNGNEEDEIDQNKVVRATITRGDGSSSISAKAVALIAIADDVPRGCIVLHPALRRQLGIYPLDGVVNVQILHGDSIEESLRSLQSEIERGSISIEVLPFEKVESPAEKPWRLPLGVAVSRSDTVDDRSVFQFDPLDPHEIENHVPICSGTIMPSVLVVGEESSENSHHLSVLRITGEDHVDTKANGVPDAPCSMLSMHQLPSLLALSREMKGKKSEAYAKTEEGDQSSNIFPPFHQWEEDYALNLLPSGAGLLKDSITWSFAVAEKVEFARTSCIRSYRTLLVGEEGTGKTHLALLIAALARLHFGIASSYLDCSQLQSAPGNQMRDILEELSLSLEENTAQTTPTLLIMDNIHALIPNVDASNDDDNDAMHHQQTNPALSAQVKLLSDHIRYLLDENPNVYVLATCMDATDVAPSLRTLEYFSSTIHVPILETNQRIELWLSMLHRMNETSSFASEGATAMTSFFGKETEGYAPSDLLALAHRVAHALHIKALGRRDGDETTGPESRDALINLIKENIKKHMPVSQRGLHVGKPNVLVEWDDIGGLFRAKAKLTDIILRPVRYRAIFKNAPISLPRGILLYGPGGCGKSIMVPALAKECNFNLVRCNGPELLDKYIGASEAKVRQLFARAYAAAPCILFLDDFDALAPRRGSDHTGVTDRVVNQLLTFLDGVESADDRRGMVYIIGASSRPDKIDPALLRPGRLEKHVYIGYTNTDKEWNDLFAKIASSRAVDEKTIDYISSGRLLQEHGNNLSHLRRLSAADLKAVMDTAHLLAVHEHLHRVEGSAVASVPSADAVETETASMKIEIEHVIEALRSCRPSLGDDDRKVLGSIYAPFYSADGNRDDGADHTGSGSNPPLGDYHGVQAHTINGTSGLNRVPRQMTTLR